MKEIWKDLDFTDNVYQISNFGRLRRKKNDIYLYTPLNQDHKTYKKHDLLYLTFTFREKTYYIHRIVALLFIPNPEHKPEVNHIDFNSLNNRVDNLEWVTRSENAKHSSINLSKAKQGEKHPKATITDSIALSIKKDRKKGFKYKQLMIKYNLPKYTIANVCTRYFRHIDEKVL